MGKSYETHEDQRFKECWVLKKHCFKCIPVACALSLACPKGIWMASTAVFLTLGCTGNQENLVRMPPLLFSEICPDLLEPAAGEFFWHFWGVSKGETVNCGSIFGVP